MECLRHGDGYQEGVLTYSMFADDETVVSQSVDELQFVVTDIKGFLAQAGLTFFIIRQCKRMASELLPEYIQLKISEEVMERVSQLQLPEDIINKLSGPKSKLDGHILKAWNCFHDLNNFLRLHGFAVYNLVVGASGAESFFFER